MQFRQQVQRQLTSAVESRAIDRPSARVQQRVRRAFERAPGGDRLQRFLEGRAWLGHPLHPLLTDVVTGGLTVVTFLDVLEANGREELAPAADAVLGMSLLATAPTAWSGLADWQHAPARPRRLGFIHAVLNTIVTAAGVRSLVLRARGRRAEARSWALVGFMLMNVSAYLGGEMIYDLGMGVDTQRVEDERREEEQRQAREDVAAA